MPKRLSSKNTDYFQNARMVVEQAIGEHMDGTPLESAQVKAQPAKKRASSRARGTPSASDVSRVMSAMGRKGGKLGGKRRMVTMTAAERRKVAVNAANTRWAKRAEK
jgi:hypothetical protein